VAAPRQGLRVLAGIGYADKDRDVVREPDPRIVGAPADLREYEGASTSPTPFSGSVG
jgi:polyphosphate kinase